MHFLKSFLHPIILFKQPNISRLLIISYFVQSCIFTFSTLMLVSDIAIFVLKRDVKLQLTQCFDAVFWAS